MAKNKIYRVEAEYQKHLIEEIYHRIDEVTILKNDSGYLQGIPDLCILGPRGKDALLEVKLHENSPHRPNQDYYIRRECKRGGFARFIYQENEEEVLGDLVNWFK